MDKQEALDKNWEWFVVRGNPRSVTFDEDLEIYACKYRGSDGCKCAAGTLIPDIRYLKGMEGKSFGTNFVEEFHLQDVLPDEIAGFVRQMQMVHDGWQEDQGDFTDYMRKELTELAKEHGLTIPKTPVAA